MYDTDLVQKLCREIADERDPADIENLISLLQSVIRDDQEEMRVRMAFLKKKYSDVISDAKAAD